MFKKSIHLIKNNPIIILSYGIYLAISFLLMFFLYPKSLGIDTYMANDMFDYSLYMATMRNLLIAILLIFIISLFFISGFNNMVREAVFTGKTKIYSFIDGIKNYFGRVILSVLLMVAIVVVASILLGILSIPFTIMAASNGIGSIYTVTLVIMLVTLLLFLVPAPFLILWFPALFLEDTGLIRSLKMGAKAGAKNYWRLLLVTLLLVSPQMIYTLLNYNVMMTGTIYNLGYFIMLGIMAVLSLIYNIYTFVVYHEYRIGLITIQQQQEANINP